MLPRAIGLAGQQINLIIITAIASTLTVGSIAVFNFANNIQGFPVGVIGLSFAIAAFPSLSKSWAEKRKGGIFKEIFFNLPPDCLTDNSGQYFYFHLQKSNS